MIDEQSYSAKLKRNILILQIAACLGPVLHLSYLCVALGAFGTDFDTPKIVFGCCYGLELFFLGYMAIRLNRSELEAREYNAMFRILFMSIFQTSTDLIWFLLMTPNNFGGAIAYTSIVSIFYIVGIAFFLHSIRP